MHVATALAWRLAVQTPGEVQWQAPPECPDRAALQAAIERRLGRPLTGAVVDARVSRERRGYSLRLALTVDGRAESRELADESCAALTEAVALRVAAAFEAPPPIPEPPTLPEPPLAAEPIVEATAQPETPAPRPAPTPVVPEAEPPPPVPEDRSWRPGGVLRLHGGGEVGALPGVTGAVGVAGGLLWRRLRLELGATYLAPRTADGTPADVRVQMLAGGLQVCGRLGRGAVEVPLCGGLEGGVMRGDGSGLPSARRASAGWLAGVLGAGVVWHATARFGLWSAVQLAVAPVRPRFELSNERDAQALFTPYPVSGRLLLGVELRISDPW